MFSSIDSLTSALLSLRLKNLHRQAFSEETQMQNPSAQPPVGADQQPSMVAGQPGTGQPDNIAFWVPPNVANRSGRRNRYARGRNTVTIDCAESFTSSPNLASSPISNMPLHESSGLSASTEVSGDSSGVTGTLASMDLFKRFTEKAVEAKNAILGAEAINSLTSVVNSVNISEAQPGQSVQSPSLQQQNSTGSNGGTMSPFSQSVNNGYQTAHFSNTVDPNAMHIGASGDPPPVVIPNLHKSGSSKKGVSMHQAIDFRQINTNLYEGERKRMPTVQRANVDVESGDDEVGTVKLTFEYHRANGIFLVTIDKVNGLPAPDDGTLMAWDSYCHIQLLPDKHIIATKVVRDSLNPDFNEQIMFDVADEDDLPNRILEITVAHRDQSSTGWVIGWLRLALNSFDFASRPGPMEVYRPLVSPDKKEGTKALGGNILISVSYLASAKRLTVYAHEAKSLKFQDDSSNSGIDASVRVCLLIDGKRTRKRKSAAQHGQHVVWNEAITFTDISPETWQSGRFQAIDIEVIHDTLLGEKPLGHVVLNQSSNATAQVHWLTLRQGDDSPRWHRLRFN